MQREEFDTYEQAAERLVTFSGFSLPNPLVGAHRFLRSLHDWIDEGDDSRLDRSFVVFPDPAKNLSLPYPMDELSLALSARGVSPTTDQVIEFSSGFSISRDLLDRPVTALSGGERMLVSLCKASALATKIDRVCLLSPYFWLDAANRTMVKDKLTDMPGVDTRLLVLRGEDDQVDLSGTFTFDAIRPLGWRLLLDAPQVIFPVQCFPRFTPEKRLRFVGEPGGLELRSPTLIRGRNGVGKTTLAKLMAGVMQPDTGHIGISTGGFGGSGRLLLQDSIVHLFGQAIGEHLGRVFCFDREYWKEARKLFETLQRRCIAKVSSYLPGLTLADGLNGSTVLHAKFAVTVDRLFGAPPLLILDEPGWCLSHNLGKAYLEAAVSAAHERGIAVALISHQSHWWEGLVADTLEMIAVDDDTVEVRRERRSTGVQ